MGDEKRTNLLQRIDVLERELAEARQQNSILVTQVDLLRRAELKMHRAQAEREEQLRRIESLNDLALHWNSEATPDRVIADVIALMPSLFSFEHVFVVATEDAADSLGLQQTPHVIVDALPAALEVDRATILHGPEVVAVVEELAGTAAADNDATVVVPVRLYGCLCCEIVAVHRASAEQSSIVLERPLPKHEQIFRMLAGYLDYGISHAVLTQDLWAANGRLQGMVRKLETTQDRLVQASKLEAVGRLAGGVAHDFNNLLTVILSYSAFVMADEPSVAPDLVQIVGAAERAAALTNQLLAFSRQQERSLTDLDLNEVVSDLGRMLQRVLGEDILLQVDLADDLPAINADRGQLDQVLLNLVVNARDAVGVGGTIVVRTSASQDEQSKPVVRLTVEDDGCGMDAEVLDRIFEPFFTTKEVGRGTGMGLATVYGIVKQGGGEVSVYSEQGNGTRFEIDYPAVVVARPVAESESIPAPQPGSETLLVVEDEASIRTLLQRTLSAQGYEVLLAADGEQALELAAGRHIDLVITDVIMPNLGGVAMIQQLRELRPGLPTLLMSGYPADQLEQHGLNDDYLCKPFTPKALLVRIRAILDQPRVGLAHESSGCNS